MGHGVALEGLEVAATVAEIADMAMGVLDRRKEHISERETKIAEEALAKERAENLRLRSALEAYGQLMKELDKRGMLEQMEQQMNGLEPDQFCERLKSKVDSPDFLKKLSVSMLLNNGQSSGETSHSSVVEGAWEVVNETENGFTDNEGYIVVTQEDILDGIATFMAKYLQSIPSTKNMSPEELQKALSNAFTVKDKKSRITRLWKFGRVMYTVASWTATAVGLYRNPMVLRAASMAVWTAICVLSRFIK